MLGFTSWVGRCFVIFIMLAVWGGNSPAVAATCNVVGPRHPSDAEDAFLHSDYDRAVVLYQAQLQQKPNDPTLIAGLAEVLLRQQKVTEAEDLVQKALAQAPQSAVLMAALGFGRTLVSGLWLSAAAGTSLRLIPGPSQSSVGLPGLTDSRASRRRTCLPARNPMVPRA